MAILQISRIQHRRGLQQDLPQLASGELGWSIDARKLYIGNGTIDEGAPETGVTEVVTEFYIKDFITGFSSNVSQLESDVLDLQAQVTILAGGSFKSNIATLAGPSSGTIRAFTANNAVINYTATQAAAQRSGQIRASRFSSNVSYDEEYSQTAATDLILTITANTTHMNIDYSTTSATSMLYTINSLL